MILKSLTIKNFGPFAYPTTISIDDLVTVLTGQNDTGKSSILRAINMVGENTSLKEEDVNVDHIFESNVPWDEDDDIYCIATYKTTKDSNRYFSSVPGKFLPGWEVDVKFYLAPKKKKREVVGLRNAQGAKATPSDAVIRSVPEVLYLHPSSELNTIPDAMNYWNNLDTDFSQLAFGANYVSKLKRLNRVNLTREIRSAAERLTKSASRVLPPSMGLEFVFDRIGEGESADYKFIMSLRDKNDSDTAIYLRGTGIQKIIAFMIAILNKLPSAGNLIVLIDEPENSLHANAQHMLRAFLEELSESEKIQTIYATHSPSMINPMQSHRIRLFERTNKRGKATTVVNNQPISDNFYPIRSSLGISPSDSLLYAPITIIVEGATEILGLPILLQRLFKEDFENFENIDKLLAFSHLLDGHGASFEYWCRVAKSQGCKPIIFVDGDKIKQVRQQRVPEEHPDVPLIVLENMSEFEEIIPKEAYFEALAQAIGDASVSLVTFTDWEKTKNLPERMAFTKRIDYWLDEIYPDFIYDKPDIMKDAIERVELSDVNLKSIELLMDAMENILNENQY